MSEEGRKVEKKEIEIEGKIKNEKICYKKGKRRKGQSHNMYGES